MHFFLLKIWKQKKRYYFCSRFRKIGRYKKFGRIAQLVQSTWFTPKGSGVRIPLRPRIERLSKGSLFLYPSLLLLAFEAFLVLSVSHKSKYFCFLCVKNKLRCLIIETNALLLWP